MPNFHIQLKQGTAAQMASAASTFTAGEQIYATDEKKVYVSDGAGTNYCVGGGATTNSFANLADVTISSVANLEIPQYISASSKWLNKTFAEAGIAGTALANTFAAAQTFDAALIGSTTNHLLVQTTDNDKTVRINSRTYTATSGDIIGFQSKPGAGADGTVVVYGCQVSPRFVDAMGGSALVGVQADCILKGTSGDLTGDIRGFEGRLSDENSAGRTIAGTASSFYASQMLAAHTFTGGVYPIHVTPASGATAWSGFAKLPDDNQVADDDATQAITNLTTAGYIKVTVGSSTRYIWLASNAPT